MKVPAISAKKICRISAKDQQLNELENKIGELFALDLVNDLSTSPILSSSWQQARLTQVIQKLEFVIKELKKEAPLDAVCGILEDSYGLVKELNGKDKNNQNLLEIIFSKFCLGK